MLELERFQYHPGDPANLSSISCWELYVLGNCCWQADIASDGFCSQWWTGALLRNKILKSVVVWTIIWTISNTITSKQPKFDWSNFEHNTMWRVGGSSFGNTVHGVASYSLTFLEIRQVEDLGVPKRDQNRVTIWIFLVLDREWGVPKSRSTQKATLYFCVLKTSYKYQWRCKGGKIITCITNTHSISLNTTYSQLVWPTIWTSYSPRSYSRFAE